MGTVLSFASSTDASTARHKREREEDVRSIAQIKKKRRSIVDALEGELMDETVRKKRTVESRCEGGGGGNEDALRRVVDRFDRIVTYLDAWDVLSISKCGGKRMYETIASKHLYWYVQSINVFRGNFSWLFGNKYMKDHSKTYDWEKASTWFLTYVLVRRAQHDYVRSSIVGKAFPKQLMWGKEVWTRADEVSRAALDMYFRDYLFTFESYCEGAGDNQCDIYPIGFMAYVRGRKNMDIADEKDAGTKIRDLANTVDPNHPGLEYLEGDVINDIEPYVYESSHMTTASILRSPILDQTPSGTTTRRATEMVLSYCLSHQLMELNVERPVDILRIMSLAINDAMKPHEFDRDGGPELVDGHRPDEKDRRTLYGSDVAKSLDHSIKSVLTTSEIETSGYTLNLSLNMKRYYRYDMVDQFRGWLLKRISAHASAYLSRVHETCGGSKRADPVVRIALSDADRMPIGPRDNDHNGAIHEAQISPHWVWIVLGKSDRC